MSVTNEDELVERARNGDSAAMNDLLGIHYERLYAICRRLAGNDADAADACQEALIAIVKGMKRFDGRSKFSTWSYRVATNACLDELRRRKRRPIPTDDDHEQDVAGSASLEADTIQRMDLDGHLQALPVDFRAPIVCRDVIGMDYAEIAETLGIPPGTVRSRIARGRKQLAQRLEAAESNVQDSTKPGNQSRPPERQIEQP